MGKAQSMAIPPAARRPLLLRAAPALVRSSLYSRYYSRRHHSHPHLFEAAELALAPGTRMFDLKPRDIISGHIAFTGRYEPKLSRMIRQSALEGGLFVDVGANMGYFSLLWASARPDNRVVAVEASPRVVALLSNNIARNGYEESVRIIPKAVSDRAGTIRFATGPEDQTGWGGILPDGPDGIEVPAIRLDEELAGQDIAVLKIDIEGADALALKGAEGLLREKRIGRIFFESNPSRAAELGLSIEGLIGLVTDSGYRCIALDRARCNWMAVPA